MFYEINSELNCSFSLSSDSTISFTVEGEYTKTERNNKVAISRWLLGMWRKVHEEYPSSSYYCVPYSEDGFGDYRANVYRKLGFRQSEWSHFMVWGEDPKPQSFDYEELVNDDQAGDVWLEDWLVQRPSGLWVCPSEQMPDCFALSNELPLYIREVSVVRVFEDHPDYAQLIANGWAQAISLPYSMEEDSEIGGFYLEVSDDVIEAGWQQAWPLEWRSYYM